MNEDEIIINEGWMNKSSATGKVFTHIAIIGIGSGIGYMASKLLKKKPLPSIFIGIVAMYAIAMYADLKAAKKI